MRETFSSVRACAPSLVLVATFLLSLVLITGDWSPTGQRCRAAAPETNTSDQRAPDAARKVVTLSKDDQRKAGISVAPLKAMTHAQAIPAYGAVLQVQGLTDQRSRYVQAVAASQGAAAKARFSQIEYERLKRLNAEDKNVSDKAVASADAVWRAEGSNAEAAAHAVTLLEAAVRQQWGRVIAGWLLRGSPQFDKLLSQTDALLQLTLPHGTRISTIPHKVKVTDSRGGEVTARFVSLSPQIDPSIQGLSFFYTAHAPERLPAGLRVVAAMPAGPPVSGVLVPSDAVVWSGGKPWAYLRKSAEEFVRREVPTTYLISGGYFVTQGFKAGTEVVVAGAQLLLSQEFRSRIKGGD